MKSLRLQLARIFLVLLFSQGSGAVPLDAPQHEDMADCGIHAMTDMLMDMDIDTGSCGTCIDGTGEGIECCLDDCRDACHLATTGTTILPPAFTVHFPEPSDPLFMVRQLYSTYHGLALIRPPSLA